MTEPGFATYALATEPNGPEGEFFEPIRRHLGAECLGVNRLELQPRQRLRVHIHERQEELYLVLSGTLTLIVEEVEKVTAPAVVRVSPGTARSHRNEGDEPVEIWAVSEFGHKDATKIDDFWDPSPEAKQTR